VGGLSIPAETLRAAPRPIALRAVAALTAQAGGSGEADHRARALDLAEGQSLDLPGCAVICTGGRLYFGQRRPPAPDPVPLEEGSRRWGGWTVTCVPAVCPETPGAPDSFYLAPGMYTIRTRREGDGLRPPGRPYKTLKKWMIQQGVPAQLRAQVPVLDREGRAVAAGGVGVDTAALASPGCPCYHITITK
jgi:tRNA(Ile)-lysidine synthase